MNIPANLTREEFERLANREPRFDGDFIYRLVQKFINWDDLKKAYPKFEFDYETVRLFRSFDDAVTYLQSKKKLDVYCSWITQIPAGAREFEHTAEWLYDKDGNLLDYSVQKSHGDHNDLEFCFFGRPAHRQRFKEGDIVEVISGNEVRLALLCHPVPDVEWCWDYYKRALSNDRYYGLDYTDEAVYILDGPSHRCHSHPSPLQLMKPRFRIPSNIEADMKTWKERADKEEEEYLRNHKTTQL